MINLRKLPFDPKNNPVVSEETCNFHYGKHHKAYVDNFNKLVEKSDFKNLYEAIKSGKGGIFNNAAQIYNHDFYWDCIANKSEMSKEFQKELNNSFKDFKEEFLKAASTLFGSGWCWLVYDIKTKKLEIIQTTNADTPVTQDKVPLLVVDVWEHAYYLDEQNARAKYLEKFYDNIDWAFVSDAYEWALKEGMGSVEFYINDIHSENKKCSCGCGC